MRILLAIDDSPHSQAVVDGVAQQPWPTGSMMRVLNVVKPLPPAGTELWYTAGFDFAVTEKELASHARDLTSGVAGKLAAAGLNADASVRTGDPRSEIVDEAADWNADLIVIGSHGYKGLKRLLLGSVAHYVVSHAPCSVEVVRRKNEMH